MEVDEDEASGKAKTRGPESFETKPVHKHIVEEMIRCIDVAADFEDSLRGKGTDKAVASGRRTWVAVKLVRISFSLYF